MHLAPHAATLYFSRRGNRSSCQQLDRIETTLLVTEPPSIFTPEYYARMRELEQGSSWNAGMRDIAALLLVHTVAERYSYQTAFTVSAGKVARARANFPALISGELRPEESRPTRSMRWRCQPHTATTKAFRAPHRSVQRGDDQ